MNEQVWRSTAAARLQQLSVAPPTTRGVSSLGVGVDARVDALGREGDEDVLAGGQPAALERLDEQPARRADRRRRGEDDRLARAGVGDHRLAGAAQRAQVGLAVARRPGSGRR